MNKYPGVAYCLELASDEKPSELTLNYFLTHLQAQLAPEEKIRLMRLLLPEFEALMAASQALAEVEVAYVADCEKIGGRLPGDKADLIAHQVIYGQWSQALQAESAASRALTNLVNKPRGA